MKKKTTQTSLQAHNKNKVSGLYSTQNAQALTIISTSEIPLTSREVHRLMCKVKGLDISSARRSINTLENQGLIAVVGTRKCRTTGKTVQVYAVPTQKAA